MLEYDFHNMDANVTHLAATRRKSIGDACKNFVCHKGTRIYSRFFLVLDGETKFVFFNETGQRKCVVAARGQLVYLPDDIAYSSSWKNKNKIDYISIEFKLRDDSGAPVLLNDEIKVIATDKYGILIDAFEKFYSTYTAGGYGYKLKCKSLFYDILTNILLENAHKENNGIQKSIMFLESNYIGEISVKELSRMCNMCESAFRAQFKQIKGMTPVEYKNYLRIKRAAELLRNVDYTVTDACEAVNISDLCYFSKLFKRYIGTSPRDYKSNLKGI